MCVCIRQRWGELEREKERVSESLSLVTFGLKVVRAELLLTILANPVRLV